MLATNTADSVFRLASGEWFERIAAYLAMITGLLGVVSIARLGVVIILNALFATAWLLFVGYRVYRLGAARRGRGRTSAVRP
jgi:hypothetical protein